MKRFYFLLLPFFLLASFTPPDNHWREFAINPDFIHRSVKEVTDVMVHDIYSPPVASRIYAYTTIAGYEAAIQGSPQYLSLAGQLHGLTPMPKPQPGKEYNFSLAAVQAILMVGRTLVQSEGTMDNFHDQIVHEFKAAGMPDTVYQNSIEYGSLVAKHILAWADKDNYKQTRSFPKYDLTDDEGTWKPTPPAYIKAVEPHWSKIRTFLLDSAQQFKPLPATPFSHDKNSHFYKQAKEVRDVGLKLTPEQKEVALFWDCNPFKMNVNGHVMYATKKISPGGHWINITRLACKQKEAGFVQTAEAYACLSVAIADGFISCWDEKYRSNVIRPETYINQYMDESWVPLLQTPPFPEYTSGHSVISTASAIMLTKLFGDNFKYADSTEVEFKLPVRQFNSFKQAAAEAAVSRLYGGIHYRPAIENGVQEGGAIGNYISKKLRTRKEDIIHK